MQSTSDTANGGGLNDALDFDILHSDINRCKARSLILEITEALPQEAPLYAILTAFGSVFSGICDDYDVDVEAAFGQVLDSLSRSAETMAADRSYTAHNAMVALN